MNFYLISPPRECKHFNYNNFKKILESINVKYLQLRPKYENDKQNKNYITKYFKIFDKICRLNKIKLIINDDVNLVKELQSDGVHLGQNDLSCKKAREFLGPRYEIGVSCGNSIILAHNAKRNGANYVAFGPMFKSKTKLSESEFVDIKLLKKKKKKIPLPFTLIGGINHINISKLKDIGFDNVALIQSIWKYKYGPIKSAEIFKSLGFCNEN